MRIVALLLLLHLPTDVADLRAAAAEYGVPPWAQVAVAITESGYAGGNAMLGPGVDSAGVKVCREVGRMEIRPCDNWGWLSPHCRSLTIYRSNIRCGAAILALRHAQLGSWGLAIQAYNGKGPASAAYRAKVERLIGQLVLGGGE